MPEYTPTLALPYPGSGDAPCDFAEQWCDFTGAVNTILDRFEDSADRIGPVIPMAKLSFTGSVSAGGFVPISFDTVEFDTAGWTDIDANPRLISPTVGGRLTLVGAAEFTSTDLVNTEHLLGFVTEPASTAQMNANVFVLTVTPFTAAITVEQDVYVSPGTWVPGVSGLALATAPTVTLTFASFTVYWHADGANP